MIARFTRARSSYHSVACNAQPQTGISLRARITLPLLLPVLGLLALSGFLLTEKLTTVVAMQRVGALTTLVTRAPTRRRQASQKQGQAGPETIDNRVLMRDGITAAHRRSG